MKTKRKVTILENRKINFFGRKLHVFVHSFMLVAGNFEFILFPQGELGSTNLLP